MSSVMQPSVEVDRSLKFAWKFTLGCLLCLVICSASVNAERPRCYQLLPSKTLAYLRIADLNELGDRFNETSIGRMSQETQIKSLTTQLFEEAEDAFIPIADQIGLSLSELLAIPSGEIAFAVTAPPQGWPAPVLMVDIEGQEANAVRLLDVVKQKLQSDGNMSKSHEVIGGTKLEVFSQDRDERFTGVIFFRRDGMLVATSNIDVARQIVAAWDGDADQKVLEENEDFADVMRHSKGPRGATPQIRWYVDPISFAKVAMRGNSSAQIGLAMLPAVGLDGLLAVGGSVTLASDEYDSFLQTHLIAAEPRTGALAALAMKTGSTEPEDWVPHDVASYLTLHWDFVKMEKEVAKLYNSFRGDDAFEERVLARANEALGVDVLDEVVAVSTGRVSLATWYPRPVRPQNVAYVGGIQFQEDADMEATWQKVREKSPTELSAESYGGFTIYSAPESDVADEEQRGGVGEGGAGEGGAKSPPARISMALVDNYLLISNRPEHIQRAIVTRSASGRGLANELDFKLVASKSRRQRGGKAPGYFSFNRPEEAIRVGYELLTAEETRQGLSRAAEKNEFLGRVNRALEQNPLPPFQQIQKYLAPTGSVISVDETGFHYSGFGLKRR